ncbi:E3 ubiquitin/ISG15 ligase TRIM25 [Rhinichthys klamathensis goyatoka]|uniref:E3 ubiquitin/ISG15 ligase TRIM25 n=1 Tax=Rhinichthys klamathensis goyatoka TaxID=3034132 RepID=UPI0024B60707|nr:E3 ubiquitin/ISG15 ligase TRIM25 [Rhinichthys klamathensis goyatoka]
MEELRDTEEFRCSICLDVLKDPAAIPCGHRYCIECINDFWNKKDHLGVFSCPQCAQTFSPRPILNDTILADMVDKPKKLELPGNSEICSNYMQGDVTCDFCTSIKQKAVKSCLVCLACQNHLQAHNKSPALKKHKLVEASVNLNQEKICPHHHQYLEIYCRTDQQCICPLCVTEDHKGHDTVPAAVESTKKQKELGMTRQKYKLKIHTKEKDLLELKQAVDALKSSEQAAMKNGEQIFNELQQSIERRRCKFRDLIRDQERAAESMLQTLEQEITELKLRDHELEMLLKSEDHVHVLQNCHSFSSGLLNPPFTVASLSDFSKVNNAISALKKKLEVVFKGEWLRVYQAARSMKILHCTVPRIRSEFLHHSCPLQLNPLTAHKDLSLSNGNREAAVQSQEQSCPDHPERFDYWCQVLGTEGLTGCCYWEVEWSGMGVNIAVAYTNIARKGESNEAHFGHNDKSWSLFCCRRGYAFRHNRIVSKISEPGSSKIGVYLDYRAGTLAFYSIDDSMTLLHRVQTTFIQPLYPGFEFVSCGASIKLCQLE